MSDLEETRDQPLLGSDLLLLFGGGFGLYLALSVLGRGLDGPSYLVLFGLIWCLLMLIHIGLRRIWRDSFFVSGAAAAVLAAVAFARYRWGVEQGMRRWDFLIIMTIVGCATFFLRAGQFADSERGQGSDTSWWSSSCSSAGDGGGGGCGGGCGGGGCGGCGGG